MRTSGSTTGTVAVSPGTSYAWALYVRDAYRVDPQRTAHRHRLQWPVPEQSPALEDLNGWIVQWDTWWQSICDFQSQRAPYTGPGLDVRSRLRMLRAQSTAVPGGDRPDLLSLAPLPRIRESALPLVQSFTRWWSASSPGVKQLVNAAIVTSARVTDLPEQGEVRIDVLPTDFPALLWLADDYAVAGIAALRQRTPSA